MNEKTYPIDSPYEAPLLETKLNIPSRTVETMVRPRLIERLNWCATVKLTLICAPVGFGKSTLLQHWALQAPERPAWFSVEPADNDPVRFWRYVIAAIDRIRPGFRVRTADVVKLVHPSDYELALTMLLNELQQTEKPLALILDDFHSVTNESLLDSFSFFLDHLPENVHLIVASRTELPIPTAKLRSYQSMERLDAEELSFTPQEGSKFYSSCMALDLQEEETNEWVRRTEGWIAAMKLAALSIRDSRHPSILLRNLSGASHLLEQYLMEEVFIRQSESIRQFLMDCSVLKRMNASLCRAVTGESRSQEMLELLEHVQLFIIPLDDQRGWYRLHHLFAEFLLHRLQRESPNRMPILLEVAGQWCEQEGLKEEALEYYLTGKHYDLAIRLLEEMTAKMIRLDTLWLSSQLALIPEPILLERPTLYFSYVHSLLLGDNDFAKVDRMLLFAEQMYEEKMVEWTEEARDDYWGSYYFIKAYYELVVSKDREQGYRYMIMSKQHKPTGVNLVFARPKRSGLPSILKEYMQKEEGHPGQKFLIPILTQLAEMMEQVDLANPVTACLAECYYEFDELDEAEKAARKALQSTGLPRSSRAAAEALLPARLVLARIQRIRGLIAAAKETLRETRRDLVEMGMAGALIFCDAELAQFALEEGDTAPADAWERLYSLNDRGELSVWQLYEQIYWSRLLMKRGRDEQAWRLTDRLLATGKRENRLYIEVEAGLMQVVMLYRSGRTEEALQRFQSLLYVAEPHGLRRVFLDAGEPAAELVSLLLLPQNRQREKSIPSIGYLRSLLSGFGKEMASGDSSANLKMILTKKEYEILRLLTQRLTNREISAKLGIGYGTVRTHLNNIYSKLFLEGREEAIQKGEQIGL
ncbi:hypothetical protein EHV15_33315 [Paenibacillus oralis]|uniref:HTH luxR-type domain-containing protein n=1 Tax=Paenibacillus oralis TaxID=2490856 RepID=A0A3P3UAV0_9BACL|nr:LuxR C-terminal-related transcriptional regulator [Paenibacillus oralis]RRJ67264.1 hypothetical protein EHV15_33315 [Paenibacillus oralis]